MQITEEIRDLFDYVRVKLGAPIRQVQLEDDMLCKLLDGCVGMYAEKVLNWVTQSQWMNFMGNNQALASPTDLAFALTTRSMDFTKDFSNWFSKDTGLQAQGNFELKKDFITVERGKQCYIIPSGREINKVLYVTPSTTKAALYGNYSMIGMNGGFGMAQYPNMMYGNGFSSFFVGQAYDVALMAADLKYKNSLIRGDLTYKVTAGPEGTHIIHLLSTPGSHNSLGYPTVDDSYGWGRYHGCYVWYTYYDISSKDELEACLLENRDNMLITPDQIPLKKMRYELMNEPTQQTVRQLLVAESMITLGLIRGTYNGVVKIPNAEMTLDYSIFLEEGKKEKERVMTELKERLDAMLPWNMMKNQSDMTDSLMNILKNKPISSQIIVI